MAQIWKTYHLNAKTKYLYVNPTYAALHLYDTNWSTDPTFFYCQKSIKS